MESMTRRMWFLLICLGSITRVLYSQNETEINYGALINSRWLNDTLITHFNMNTAATRARVSATGQTSNFDTLKARFLNIIAMNDSSIADTATIIEENRDYIYYYTNALYSKWEAEGNTDLFPVGSPTGIKPATGTSAYNSGGISGLRSGSISPGSNMFSGPNYSQYIRYVITNKWNANRLVKFKVNFRMKASYETEGIVPLALIRVKLVNTKTNFSYILAYDTLTSGDLSTSYGNYYLEYDYRNYAMYISPPDTDIVYWSPRGVETETPFYDPKLKINYEVIPLGNAEIFVDYIEVYDKDIWENDIIYEYSQMINKIYQYSQMFSSLSPNLKYFNGIDEPHTLDSYEPIRRVQAILDSLNISTPLHIRFYPEWNNERDGLNAFRTYYRMAQPTRLIFWFAPFWVGDPIRFNMSVFHNILDTANALDPNFLIEAQAWGFSQNNNWIWHYAPDSIRFSTQTLMSLAHGAKGVLFEHFYSYNSWMDSVVGQVFYHGLVDKINDKYVPNPRYNAAVAINRRLSGPLGIALNKLSYGRQSINFLNYTGSSGDSLTADFLKMYYPGSSYFASILDDSTDLNNNKHFMVINADSVTLSATASFKLSILQSPLVNWSVRDVEGGIDYTFNSGSEYSFSDSLSAGQGKLYKVSPVINYGGNLLYNETVSSACALKEKTLSIKPGAALTVNANYTASQDIIVESGGKLVINPGKTLTFTEGAKLRVFGKFISNGTENDEININFSSLTESQNGIFLDSLSVDTLEYTNINNGYYGINIYYCNPYVYECNISGGEVGIYADHSEYDWEADTGNQIINCTVTGAGSYALDLLGASPAVQGCHLSSAIAGVHIGPGSSPLFTKYYSDGLNQIYGDTLGIAATHSSPVLGMGSYGNFYGLNSITGFPSDANEYDILLSYCGLVMAEDCWWGEEEGIKSSFMLEESDIDFEPYLTSDPFAQNLRIQSNKPMTNGPVIKNGILENPELTINQRYRNALDCYLRGRRTDAWLICRELLREAPDSVVAYSALNLAASALRKSESGRDTLLQFLGEFITGGNAKEIYGYAKLLKLDNKVTNNYPEEIDEIIRSHSGSGIKPLLLFKKLKYYFDITENRENALTVKNELERSYPGHILTREAKILIGEGGLKKGSIQKTEETNISPILENYPNPFNPSTTIRYGINTAGAVHIGIYSILGELVQTLVNEEKERGIHTILLQAGRLSSGMYICRMISVDGIMMRKVMLLK